jgi:hypothetical protein
LLSPISSLSSPTAARRPNPPRAWQNALDSYPRATPSTEALPDVRATVEAAFDLAARVLAAQRELTKAFVSVATQTFKTIAEQVAQIADQTIWAGHREADVSAKAGAPVRPAEQRDQRPGWTEPPTGSNGATETAGPDPATPAAAPKRPGNVRRPDDA